jgi:hypothetical protein
MTETMLVIVLCIVPGVLWLGFLGFLVWGRYFD